MSISQDEPDFAFQGSSKKASTGYPSLDEFHAEKLKEQQEEEEENQDYTVSRGELKSDLFKSYDKIFYNNTFKVSTPILLLGVSFFGPPDELPTETRTVCVTIGVNESHCFLLNNKKSRRRPKTNFLKVMKTPEKGKKFRVDFQEPILIKAKMWYDIEFQVNGCPLGCMDLRKIKTDFSVSKTNGSDIAEFTWLVGSCQMPDIHFRFPA